MCATRVARVVALEGGKARVRFLGSPEVSNVNVSMIEAGKGSYAEVFAGASPRRRPSISGPFGRSFSARPRVLHHEENLRFRGHATSREARASTEQPWLLRARAQGLN